MIQGICCSIVTIPRYPLGRWNGSLNQQAFQNTSDWMQRGSLHAWLLHCCNRTKDYSCEGKN
jgi:hypothetical protein